MERGHNIVADGWAGAANPQPHPKPTTYPPPTHSHTNNTNCSIINTHFSSFQLECDNSSVTDGPTDGPMDQRTDGRTDGRTKPLIELLKTGSQCHRELLRTLEQPERPKNDPIHALSNTKKILIFFYPNKDLS